MPVRKIPRNYRNITGIAAHTKAIGSAAFESTLERDFLSLIEFSNDVTKFEVQPVSIEWLDFTGKRHSYIPDVLVHYKQSGRTKTVILYEIKYRSDLKENWQALKPKFKAAIKYCKARGWHFKVVTEVEIRTLYLDNVRFLQPYVFKRLFTNIMNRTCDCSIISYEFSNSRHQKNYCQRYSRTSGLRLNFCQPYGI